MDAFELTLCGRDRTYSTIVFPTCVAHVANDDACVLPAVFARAAASQTRGDGRAVEPTAGSCPANLEAA